MAYGLKACSCHPLKRMQEIFSMFLELKQKVLNAVLDDASL